jgi:hypothetical protein
VRRLAAVAIALLALALAACGQSVILQKPTQRLVADFVFKHAAYRPSDVTCPSGVPARIGRSFQCHFTGPDGRYTAYMLITNVKGSRVLYRIQTQRNGQTILVAQAEQAVSNFVFSRKHIRPRNVTCPAGVAPLVGHTLTCHFAGPNGTYKASVQILSVNRGRVEYRIQTTGPLTNGTHSSNGSY